jgi:GST-like protein
MGLEYDAHLINIMKNDQFTPEFIAVNPNSKIPAIVDPDGPGELVMFCASPNVVFLPHRVLFLGLHRLMSLLLNL